MQIDRLPPVAAVLDELGIHYRLFTHVGPIASLEQAASERDQRPEQVVRSILFRLGEGQFAMVMVAGPAQVDWKRLRRHLGQSRLTMATAEEVLAATTYPIGAVSPLGLPSQLPLYIDESVLLETELSLGSGVRGTAVILRSDDLMRALPGAEIGAFRQEDLAVSGE